MATCTAKVTVTIADQDGVVLERFRVVGEGPDAHGAKGAEVAVGRKVRESLERQFETEEASGDVLRGATSVQYGVEDEEDPYEDFDDDFFDHDDC